MTTTELELEDHVRKLADDIANIMVRHASVSREQEKEIRTLKQALHTRECEVVALKKTLKAHISGQDVPTDDEELEEEETEGMTQLRKTCEAKVTQVEEEKRMLREKLEDFQWVEFDSEESKHEYDRLFSIYGSYLGSGAAALVNLWTMLGGSAGWQASIRPSQLRLLLSREKISEVMYRVTEDRLPVRGGTLIPEEEVTGFFSNVLPRLPALQHVALYECNVSPFDWDAIGSPRLHYQPFPSLKGMDIRFTKATDCDLVTLVSVAPSLVAYNGCYTIRQDAYYYTGLWIDDWCVDYTTLDRDSLELTCGRKLLIVC